MRNSRTSYGLKFDRQSREFWEKVGLPDGAAKIYILSGVKNSNYFMPRETLSDRGPGGGGWIMVGVWGFGGGGRRRPRRGPS